MRINDKRRKARRKIELIDYYMSHNVSDYGERNHEAMMLAIKALEQGTEWIPISERLPEDFQRVLVTLVNYNGDKVVRVAEYIGKQRIFQIKENRDIWEVGEKGLLAWRPLPEPYKESEE